MKFQLGGSAMNEFKPITADGRTGFDKFGQLMSWTLPDEAGYKTGTFIQDVRSCTCYICGKGWGNTTEDLKDQSIDEDLTMHASCLFGYRKMKERFFWQDALIAAGYIFNSEEVPARYPHSTPWKRISIFSNESGHTDTGYRLVVGKRKRVWELRLHIAVDVSPLFKDVKDTKGYSYQPSKEEPEFGPYYYIHAYSIAQVVDYLLRFKVVIFTKHLDQQINLIERCSQIQDKAISEPTAPKPEPVYQYQMANGQWIDQVKESYDYNVKLGTAVVRVLYAVPVVLPIQPAEL